MIYVIVIMAAALAASVMTNVYLKNELLDARHRAYCAEEWMDPVVVEELDADTLKPVQRDRGA